jgi:hypothetical protein
VSNARGMTRFMVFPGLAKRKPGDWYRPPGPAYL